MWYIKELAMGILIKNPSTEQKVRKIATLRGLSLTAAIDDMADKALAEEAAKPRRRPTLEEMIAATEAFRRRMGLDGPQPPSSREEFDVLYDDLDDQVADRR